MGHITAQITVSGFNYSEKQAFFHAFSECFFELLFQVNIRLLHMQGYVFLFILMKAVSVCLN